MIRRIRSQETFTISTDTDFSPLHRQYPAVFARTDHIYYDISFIPLFNSGRTISEYIVQIVDNTIEYRAKEALKKTNEQLSLSLEGSRLGLWDWKIQTGEVIVNERWAEIIGYSLEELQPVTIETWTAHTHPEDHAISQEILEKHFSGELPYYVCEVRMKHKNGEWVWILDRGKVVEWDGKGRPVRMNGTHSDITERKHAEEEVKKSKEKLQMIFDSTVEAIFGFDIEKICIFCNTACVWMLGYSAPDERIGKICMS